MSGLTLNTTRNSGRKIETWSYAHPEDGKMEIEISIHTNSDSIRFTAQSTHPFLKSCGWTNTDLDALSKEVATDIDAKVALYLDADWQPAHVITVKDYKTGRGTEKSFGLVIERSDTRVNRKSTRGNRGERDVMGGGRRGIVIERHRDDHHDVDGDLTTKMRYRIDAEKSVVLVEDNSVNERALQNLENVIDRLTIRLQDRISPKSVATNPVPDLDELEEIMLKAIADVRAKRAQDT
jgi:hypothetical protein